MHHSVMEFCRREVSRYQGEIRRVLDVGSVDMNGSTRILFGEGVHYLGIDIHAGKGVDWVGKAHTFPAEGWDGIPFDALFSTECLEHDKFWEETLLSVVPLVRPGGLIVLTCATDKRAPHYLECWPCGYYRNLGAGDVVPVLEKAGVDVIKAVAARNNEDLQVSGVRKAGAVVPTKETLG